MTKLSLLKIFSENAVTKRKAIPLNSTCRTLTMEHQVTKKK